jgi:hypothetical protein
LIISGGLKLPITNAYYQTNISFFIKHSICGLFFQKQSKNNGSTTPAIHINSGEVLLCFLVVAKNKFQKKCHKKCGKIFKIKKNATKVWQNF